MHENQLYCMAAVFLAILRHSKIPEEMSLLTQFTAWLQCFWLSPDRPRYQKTSLLTQLLIGELKKGCSRYSPIVLKQRPSANCQTWQSATFCCKTEWNENIDYRGALQNGNIFKFIRKLKLSSPDTPRYSPNSDKRATSNTLRICDPLLQAQRMNL